MVTVTSYLLAQAGLLWKMLFDVLVLLFSFMLGKKEISRTFVSECTETSLSVESAQVGSHSSRALKMQFALS